MSKIFKNIKISVAITIIFSVTALIISIRSCQISKKSVDLADEANRIAVAVAKPSLLLEAKKFKDGSFIRVIRDSDTTATIEFDSRVQNNSNITVRNITLPNIMAFYQFKVSDSMKVVCPFNKAYLAPNQEFDITISVKIASSAIDSFDDYLIGIEQNRNSFRLRIQVIFISDIEKDKEYSVYTIYEIYNNKAILIESETTSKVIDCGY